MIRYRSPDEDSGRWAGFAFRDGDIVISSRSKHGTTWLQMICALLVFQTEELPDRLVRLSPWLDWLGEPRDVVRQQLDRQAHRRFIKTHTPLDGVPFDDRVSYVVVARHPLDAAISLYHQGDNIDRDRVRHLTGQPANPRVRLPLDEWLDAWIERSSEPSQALDSLPGVLHHLSDAWARRTPPNVVLVHYHDLSTDLEGSMRRLAYDLHIEVPEPLWPGLVEAATFPRMQARAERFVPDAHGILLDAGRFFRSGPAAAGARDVAPDLLARYLAHTARLAPADLLAWLHRP